MTILLGSQVDDGGSEGFNSLEPRGWLFVADQSGEGSVVKFLRTASGEGQSVAVAIYSDNGVSDRPSALLGSGVLNGGAVTSSINEITLDAPVSITAGNKYHVVFKQSGGGLTLASDSSSSTQENWSSSDASVEEAFDDPWSQTSGTTGPTPYVTLETSATPTARKGSTFDVETALSGTVTAATLAAVDVSDHITGQVGTTVSFDGGLTAEITTSGQYDLVLTDDSADPDETITVQVNVVGLPSNTARKDGALLASLTDLTLDALNASGTLVKQLTGITTDASGVISPIDLSDLSEAVGDTLKVSLHSAGSDVGVTFEQALELI